MPSIKGQLNILRQQGLAVYLKGVFRRSYYIRLQKEHGFDLWHITPYELRPYAWRLVKYLNTMMEGKDGVICEIGCGLGDIIRNVNAKEKYGFDISSEVIACAAHLDEKSAVCKTRFFVGSFQDVAISGSTIDLLLTVNFIHNIPSTELALYYEALLSKYRIRHIIADALDYVKPEFRHDFSRMFPAAQIEMISHYGSRKLFLISFPDA